MRIDYTNNTIEMEPGPNLYIMGSPNEFIRLLKIIEPLTTTDDVSISLKSKIENIEFLGEEIEDILMISKKKGSTLIKMKKSCAVMEMDSLLWKKVKLLIEGLSKSKAHQFIGFDNLEMIEDCNVIMSSEW